MDQNPNYKSLKVLLVDGNGNALEVTSILLRAFGIGRVLASRNVSTAMQVLCKTDIDLVIADHETTQSDGTTFPELVRASDECQNRYVPFILYSAHPGRLCPCPSMKEGPCALKNTAATEFMCDPLNPLALLSKITQLVEKPRFFVRTETYFGPNRRHEDDANYSGPERRIAPPIPQLTNSLGGVTMEWGVEEIPASGPDEMQSREVQ